jgi:hypothetical protein
MADRHPTPEQLYSARRGPRGAVAERHLAHAATCAECAEELARLEAFDAPDAVPSAQLAAAWARFEQAPAPAAAPRPVHARPLPALALAATLAACVLGIGFLVDNRFAQPAGTAGPGGEPTRGVGEAAGLWSPAGLLGAPPAEIVFPAPDPEPRRVTVFDATGTYRWTSLPVSGGRIPIPRAEQQRLRPGVEYFWTILGGDQAAARSFEIRPGG